MRIASVVLLLTGLAVAVGGYLARDGVALLTDQATVTGNTFVSDDCFLNNDTGFLDQLRRRRVTSPAARPHEPGERRVA
ncbi:MAG: hypothetical protein IIC91_07790 [Chloroflexi bacterium]|nr:hypothetical protein [Chloroflexota bacterium]MCH8008751.1 hypothetical protein [Chloroflexota bacterium]